MTQFKANHNEMLAKSFKFKDKEALTCLKFMIDLTLLLIKLFLFKKTQQLLFKEVYPHTYSFNECVSKITKTLSESKS